MNFLRPASFSGMLMLVVVWIAVCPRIAIGDPLDATRVPAEAKWVMHMDIDAMRESELGEYIRSKWLSRDRLRKHMEGIFEKTGMDPRKDLRSMTLYDNRFEKHHGTALIEVQNVDAQKLLTLLRERHPDVRISNYGEHRLYIWKADHGKKKDHFVTGCLYKESILVFSGETANVMVALDVFDGKAAALSDSSPLAAAAQDGTLLLARGIDMAEKDWPGRCPVLRDSDQFSLSLGESDGNLFVDSAMVTNKEETATSAVSVVDGLRAMISLRHGENEHVMRVLQGLKTNVDGTNLSIRWQAKGKDVLKAAEKFKEMHKHRKHHRRGKRQQPDSE